MNPHLLPGVYAAAVTPLKPDYSPDLDAIPDLLAFLADRGCRGALILGTTGEGPSFSPRERLAILQAALSLRQSHPDFRFLVGTGTPSLDETIELTKSAFDLGADGVVVLPPYYFRTASDEGLFAWFKTVIDCALPRDGRLLGYHFPQVSGVGLSIDLLQRLRDAYPAQFVGLKDSSGDLAHAQALADRLPDGFHILVGNDRILTPSLAAGASGCITALANLLSPAARRVWDAHQRQAQDESAQSLLDAGRAVMESCPPAPAFIKAMLHRLHALPRWHLRPPLMAMSAEMEERAIAALRDIDEKTPSEIV